MIDIIPAIDIIEGKVVRLTQGDFEQKSDYGLEPLDVARSFESAGIRQLHLVQLDNAKAGKVESLEALEKITKLTGLAVDYGGGIKSRRDVELVLEAGANQVNIGSWAVKDPEGFGETLEALSDFVILSADIQDGMIAIHGWQESSDLSLNDLIEKYLEKGLKYVTCTDISKDGKLTGPSTIIYTELKKRYPELYITASGGVSGMNDIEELNEAGIDGVIVGKALYEGKISLRDLENFMKNA